MLAASRADLLVDPAQDRRQVRGGHKLIAGKPDLQLLVGGAPPQIPRPYDTDTDKRDREEKPRAYAETAIPVYLLIDRDACETLVYSDPDDGAYSMITRRPFGKTISLPAPVGITLDTEPLKDWVR